jgi:hypothetical protein
MVFPDPAVEPPLETRKWKWDARTFTVNPKQRTRPFPFGERVSVDKPFRASFMVGLACNVIVL